MASTTVSLVHASSQGASDDLVRAAVNAHTKDRFSMPHVLVLARLLNCYISEYALIEGQRHESFQKLQLQTSQIQVMCVMFFVRYRVGKHEIHSSK